MTTSINPIDIVSENVALLSIPAPGFATSETWEQNLNDSATLPLVFLERPLIEKGHLLPQGNPEGTFPLSIYFIGNRSDLEAKQSDIEATLSAMRALKRKFLILLHRDTRVKEVRDYNTVEVANFLDLNAPAIWLKVDILIDDGFPVC